MKASPQGKTVGAAAQENQSSEKGNLIWENELLMIYSFMNGFE